MLDALIEETKDPKKKAGAAFCGGAVSAVAAFSVKGVAQCADPVSRQAQSCVKTAFDCLGWTSAACFFGCAAIKVADCLGTLSNSGEEGGSYEDLSGGSRSSSRSARP